MPHVVSLTDGTTTITLSSSPVTLRQWTPRTPRRAASGQWAPVTEALDVMVTGASTGAMQANVAAIERMLEGAMRRALMVGAGPRFYLLFQPIGELETWRSEVLAGSIDWDEGVLQGFGQRQLWGRLVVERAPFWEGVRTQIPLTNPNGTNNLAGLTISNDGTNYASIDAAAVVGALPAPLEVRLRNTSGAGRWYSGFHVGNNAFAPTMTHLIEGEARTVGGSTVADANSSGGQVVNASGSSFYLQWNLPAALLGEARGRWLRLLVRYSSIFAGAGALYSYAEIREFYGLGRLFQSGRVRLSTDDVFVDYGLVPLPPAGNGTNWSQLTLFLFFASESTATVGLDYLAFAPADELSYRRLVQRGMQVLNGDWLVDDGIEGAQYLIENGVNHPIYATSTPPVHVVPGVAQRLYVWQEGSGMRSTWTMQMQAFYRPRRLTL